jgi:hypothetical protein
MWWNQNLFRPEKFSRLRFAICPLGTLIRVCSCVRMHVERTPMQATVPVVLPPVKSAHAHTLVEDDGKSLIPFSKAFCPARATAIPPTPSSASAAVRFTPK